MFGKQSQNLSLAIEIEAEIERLVQALKVLDTEVGAANAAMDQATAQRKYNLGLEVIRAIHTCKNNYDKLAIQA